MTWAEGPTKCELLARNPRPHSQLDKDGGKIKSTAKGDTESKWDQRMPILFRGLNVGHDLVARVREEIPRSGILRLESGSHAGNMADPNFVRSEAEEWLRSPASIREKLNAAENVPLSYACGDLFGGAFYAHRGAGVPIVVELEVPWDAMRVDGRDFLYTIFTLWDRQEVSHRERVRGSLVRLFGERILMYFDRASGSFKERIGVCDIAIHDLDVIRAHHSNLIEIQGRFSTRFCSSFQIPATIPYNAIRDVFVFIPMPDAPERMLRLDDIIHP